MANYATLKAAIAAAIKQNGNNEITGNLLQQQLLAMVNSLGVGYQYVGIATPATNPGTPDQNVFYLASTAGTYANFDGLVLEDGEIAILKYNGAWSKDSTGAASLEIVNQLGQDVDIINEAIPQIRPTIKTLKGASISNGVWIIGGNYNSLSYPLGNEQQLQIVPQNGVPAYYAILAGEPNPVNGQVPNFATGFSGFREISVSTIVEIPNDGKYIVVLYNAGATIYKPENIIINDIDIFKSLQKINEENAGVIGWAKEIQPYISKNANLFDKDASDVNFGAYIQGGNINPDSNYNISGYIPVSVGTQYTHKVYPSYFGTTANRVCCYDKDKNYLGYALGVVTDGINVFAPLSGTSFVRVNIAVADMDSYMFVSGTEYPSTYIPFGISIISLDVDKYSPLYGKKLYCDGDSIMHGAAQGGVSNGGFVKPIADRFNMILQNIAVPGATIRSGTTWPDSSNRHWICQGIGTLPNDGDYYLFEGGVNDVGSSAVMGNISYGYTATLDTTTFCGAMEQCCKTLVENYPGKKYGFVFVHRIWQPTDTLANTFFDNQKAILKKWGVPFIDLMELMPSLNLIDSLKQVYTSNQDGWHPNALGYKTYYVDKIIAWLESL